MNLFLLKKADGKVEWAAEDPRVIHLKEVLKTEDGQLVDFGVVNGPRGKGKVKWTNSGSVKISLKWDRSHPSDLLPISVLVGLSRPQTCRKVIEQAATLGVAELIFFASEKGEVSYGASSLWQEEWHRLLLKGAEQAFSCHLPVCKKVDSLESFLKSSRGKSLLRLALDVYEPSASLSEVDLSNGKKIQIAIGSERGWSDKERNCLRNYGFQLYHMGQRVLRVETAMVAAVGYLSSNYWSG